MLAHLIDTRNIAPAHRRAPRTPEKVADFAGRGVDVRYIDLEDPPSPLRSLAGIDRGLSTATEVVNRHGRRIAQQTAAVNEMASSPNDLRAKELFEMRLMPR